MNYFRYKQFDKDVITVAVGYYLRYALSYRDISEILRERGIYVHHSTIYRWVQEYAPILYQIWKKKNKQAYYKWHIDETYIKIKGQWNYLYRAIDADGHTLDISLRKKRDNHSAYTFIKDKTRKFKSDIFNTQNWKYDELNDEFICPNNKRIGFKRYAYRNDRYGFKRDFKLYECDDCSACSLRQQCMKPNSKSNKKIMKNYNWEYFKAQINQKLSEPETKKIYSQRKIDVESVFGFMKAILGFTRMSVRGINKVKRELGFVLMALNIRKIAAQRAVHYKINIKKADFHQIINRNQLFYIA
ncbi:transposase DDE domain protein [Staphylococcus aureus]|nr:transposase DDE domain protein [Staphylococcus aureus]